MAEKIGFIGIGSMGQPMATRLIEAGHSLIIWNRTKSKTENLVSRGAKLADNPAGVASQADVIITMVTDGASLKSVALSEDGVLAGASSGKIYIDMSTVDPASSLAVAEAAAKKGVRYLRAPVLGSIPFAAQGKLTILGSGDKADYDQCQKIFNAFASGGFYLGAGEESRYFKLALNSMLAVMCQMLAETLVLGEKAGLDVNQMLSIIKGTGLCSPFIAFKADGLAKRDFKATFTTSMMIKDYDLVLSAAKDIHMPLPMISLVRQFLGMLEATGRGNLDFAALFLLMEELGGVKPKQ
jgi:3-hydroxyisobutyrate dehydrogenase-like beta-hydroxyacid dehydrogenase